MFRIQPPPTPSPKKKKTLQPKIPTGKILKFWKPPGKFFSRIININSTMTNKTTIDDENLKKKKKRGIAYVQLSSLACWFLTPGKNLYPYN